MKLSIHSLTKTHFDGEAYSVNAKTMAGEITVLDHHRPLLSRLRPGVITVIDESGKSHYIDSGSGFLEVESGNRMTLLIDEREDA